MIFYITNSRNIFVWNSRIPHVHEWVYTSVLRCWEGFLNTSSGRCKYRHHARSCTRRDVRIFIPELTCRRGHTLMIVMNINICSGANEPENSILTTCTRVTGLLWNSLSVYIVLPLHAAHTSRVMNVIIYNVLLWFNYVYLLTFQTTSGPIFGKSYRRLARSRVSVSIVIMLPFFFLHYKPRTGGRGTDDSNFNSPTLIVYCETLLE